MLLLLPRPSSARGMAVPPIAPGPPQCPHPPALRPVPFPCPACTLALVPHLSLPYGAGQLGCGVPVLPAALHSPLQYGGREWSCWDRLEMRAVSSDGQEMTVQEVLDWLQVSLVWTAPSRVTLGGGAELDPDTHLLQRTHGWTVTMLLRGHTVLYDREDDEETRTRQRAQR